MKPGVVSQQRPYLLRRLAAAFYDALLIAGLWMLVGLVAIGFSGGEAVPSGTLWFQTVLITLTATFFTIFWSRGGQTLGMRAWRLQLTTAEGASLTRGVAIIRFLCACVSAGALGAGFFWALIDRDRLTWHDRMCGTRMLLRPKSS